MLSLNPISGRFDYTSQGAFLAAGPSVETYPKIAFVGTSLIQQQVTGTSNTLGYSARSWINWARALGCEFNYDVWVDPTVYAGYEPSGTPGATRYFYGANFGVSGQTSASILARILDVVAARPDIVVLDNGTNEISDGFSAINANDLLIEAPLLAAGIKIVRLPILARDTAVGTSWGSAGDGRKTAARLNRVRRERARTTHNMHFFDWNNDYVDPASVEGNPFTGYTIDGTHTAILAAYTIGVQFKNFLLANGLARQAIVPTVTPDDYYDQTGNPYGNMMPTALAASSGNRPNPLMAGTGGTNGTGSSGSVATGYRVERASGSAVTVVNSLVARTDAIHGNVARGQWQRLTFTLSGAAQERFYFRPVTSTTPWPTGVAEGDWVQGEVGLRLPSAYAGFKSLRLVMDIQASGPTYYSLNEYDNGSPGGSFPTGLLPYPNSTFEVALKTPPIVVPAGSTGFRWRVEIVVDAAVAGSPVVDISSASVRKIYDPRSIWGAGPGLNPTI